MKASHLQSGEDAESKALSWLKTQGLALVARNYSRKCGEIDLIMRHGHDLVFVEVRYRKNRAFGGAGESITRKKQNKIRKTAESFLQQYPGGPYNQCRFDVIAITGPKEQVVIDWIKHAFE